MAATTGRSPASKASSRTWFDPSDHLIEDAIGATKHEDLPAKSEDAIEIIQRLVAFSELDETARRETRG